MKERETDEATNKLPNKLGKMGGRRKIRTARKQTHRKREQEVFILLSTQKNIQEKVKAEDYCLMLHERK